MEPSNRIDAVLVQAPNSSHAMTGQSHPCWYSN